MTAVEGTREIPDVPVFPLPDVVLFPGVTMPLHIFEPRYRAMTRDALAGSRLLVVAQIPTDASIDASGQPSFCRVATLGSITRHEALDDGRFNILLQGSERVALAELPFRPPYRRARATILPTSCRSACAAEARALSLTAADFVRHVRDAHPSFDFAIDPDSPPGVVADQIGHYLVVDPAERQRILEILDDGDRVHACLEALMRQSGRLGGHSVLH
jgi:ATP-dependent Lon protease